MSLVYKKLPYVDPQKIFDLVAEKYGTVFLDSRLKHDYYGRYSFIGIEPLEEIRPNLSDTLDAQLLKKFEEFKIIESDNTNLPPFTGGLMGYLSYDFATYIEPSVLSLKYSEVNQVPDYWFGLFNQIFAFDNYEKTCYLLITELPNTDSEKLLDKLEQIYQLANNSEDKEYFRPKPINLQSNFTKEEYVNAIEKAIEYIKDGEIFEVNLSQCFSGKLDQNYDVTKLYNYLQQNNPAPFAAYLNLGKLKILSASPERFLKVENNQVEVRPIKGTIRRDLDPLIDNNLAQSLQSSEKDRAENIMIVDLMRNDLSKICDASSIMVKQLCGLESFTNVHHLVSVINGKLKPEISVFDIIKSVFPAGSITGAPKIRSQQIINELEQNTPRGVSYGNIGYIGFNGNIDLSVSIRTISINNDNLSFHVGGAITLNSDPYTEYEETMLKGQKLFESLA